MKKTSIAAVTLASALAAWAPLMAGEYSRTLDEVVVTATRVSEKVSETTATINVVDSGEIEKVKYRNPAEVMRRMPGVYSHHFGGEEELTSIRIPTHFGNPYTLLLIDGLPATSYGESGGGLLREINSSSIERIEVVKGPASALYGSNAIGGVINVITKRPSNVPRARLWGEGGEDSRYRGGLTVSGSSDLLSYNLDSEYTDSQGWREHSEHEKKAAAVKLQYVLAESSLATFKLDYVNFDNQLSGSIDKADYDRDWQQSYHTFAGVTMSKASPALIYSRETTDSEFTASLLGRFIDHSVNPNYGIRYVPPPRGPAYTSTLTKVTAADTDLQLLYARRFQPYRAKLIAGFDTELGKNRADIYDLSVSRDPASGKYTGYTVSGLGESYDITTRLAAPYLQLEASPHDRWRFSLGGRYDSVRYEVTDRLGGGRGGDQDFSRLTPKAGLTYAPTQHLSFFGSYSRGFVVPTIGQLFTSSSANLTLSPEKADNYEVGLRADLLDRLLDLELSLYAMTIEDKIIVRTVDPVTRSREYINAGETSHRGVELSAVLTPADWAELAVAYSFSRNEYEDYRDPGTGTDYSGNAMPRSPDHQLNARLTVRPLQRLSVELEMDAISTQYAGETNANEYSRPVLFGLRVDYDLDPWSFWAHINNLTDEKYASYVNDSYGLSYYPGEPLTAYFGLSCQWEKK